MTDLLDSIFRFPEEESAGPAFVSDVLARLTVPALVVDKRMHIVLTNLQGQEMFLSLKSARRGRPRRHGVGALPASLRDDVKESLKRGTAIIGTGVEITGLDHSQFDVLICPGQIQGTAFGFVVVFPPRLDQQEGTKAELDRLLASFDVAVALLDPQLRIVTCNERYGSAFGRRPEEVKGLKVSELHPPERKAMLETRISYLIAAGRVEHARYNTATAGARGTLPGSVTAWPFRDGDGECVGVLALLRPSPVTAAGMVIEDVKQHFFGDVVEMMTEAVFITNADGRILVMNGRARGLVRLDGDMAEMYLGSAVPWSHPEIIQGLYDDIRKGSSYSAVLTSIDTPAGEKLLKVRGFALSRSGDHASAIFFHMGDVTEEEKVRQLLSDTARSLAGEKAIMDSVLEHTDVTFAILARDLTILRVDDQTAALLNTTAESVVGKKAEEVHPYLRQSGLLDRVEEAFTRKREVHVPKHIHIKLDGTEAPVKLSVIPVKLNGTEACLVITQLLAERGALEAEYEARAGLYAKLLSNVGEAVAVIDRHGRIVEANHIVERIIGKAREDLIGKQLSEILPLEQKGLILDYLRRATVSRKPMSTGRIRLSRDHAGDEWFADVKFLPLLPGEVPADGVMVVALFATKEKQLESQLEEYTKNLEKQVAERTRELTSTNTLLEATVGRLASMAKSGMFLSTLKDMESVMTSFLKEAREVLGADFVSVALLENVGGTSKTTYYSSGSAPPAGAIPADVVERGLSRLVLEASSPGEVRLHNPSLLTADFTVAKHRALLMAWKADGEFTLVDKNLSGLLCTQLSFSMPITAYVNDLRRERDRSKCLRQIAFRAAGVGSVAGAIRIVAEEISKTMRADRFFWLVSNNATEIWASEIYGGTGMVGRQSRRIDQDRPGCLGSVLQACHDSRKMFCDRFPRLGRGDFSPNPVLDGVTPCPFVKYGESGNLAKCTKDLLRTIGLLGQGEGWLAVAPVTLSTQSWGMLCAYGEVGPAFSAEDTCFMCLAASTVGHMWQAADAASNVRRLEAAGETVSELAHDLKYPLMRLRESIDNIKCCDRDTVLSDPGMGGISEEVDHLSLLAQELIDISNAGSHKYEIIDVIEILDHCISLTSSDSAGRSVKIDRHVDGPTLPPIFANRKDLKTVFLNVLTNCIDAAGEDGLVEIEASRGSADNRAEIVRVIVTDSGPGVPSADITRIFDPFYSRKDGGSGIGLFSAKKRANANGGDVVCEIGALGKSRFVIWFPLASG